MKKKTLIFMLGILTMLLLCLSGCGKMFTLKYEAGEGGSIEGTAVQSVQAGENGEEIIAIESEGYQFKEWSDGVTEAKRRDTNVQSDISVKAEFTKRSYTVRYETDENGTIEGDAEQHIQYGEDGEGVTAIPSEGYQFKEWSDGVTKATRQEKNIRSNLSITALFTKKTFFVRYEAGEGGYIEGNTAQMIQYGENGESVTAIPSEGYQFEKWSDGVMEATRQEKNIRSNLSITALFTKKTFFVRYEAGEGGYIEGNTAQMIQYGENGESVTAIPKEGYEFERWLGGIMSPTRAEENVRANHVFKALFRRKSFTVTYQTNVSFGGYIEGFTSQTVFYGESTQPVTAKTHIDPSLYNWSEDFIYWSDGSNSATRQEEKVFCDMEFTAYFGYHIEFVVDEGRGGKIIGNTSQRLLKNQEGESVTAVADAGFVFSGWSDLSLSPDHEVEAAESHWEYIAYFEPIEKKFLYDYGSVFQTPLENAVTINRDRLKDAKFIVPQKEGYVFCGWYADENYQQKVADETGRLMLGLAAFNLETNDLYARWRKEGEEEELPVYKLLLSMTSEVHALLYSSETKKDETVDYIMSGFERKFLSLVPSCVSEYLNEWFLGKVKFEVDTYFTIDPIGTKEKRVGRDSVTHNLEYGNKIVYSIHPLNIVEIGGLIGKYHSVLNTYSLNDYDFALGSYSTGGAASNKYGYIGIEAMFYSPNHDPLQDLYLDILNRTERDGCLDTYLHEFVHTVEYAYAAGKSVHEFHDAYGKNDRKYTSIECEKHYLLNELEVNGQIVGIPQEFWQHKLDVHVWYVANVYNGRDIGKIYDANDDCIGTGGAYSINVAYGSDFTVEAKPNEGYRFVRWSDGITTARRTDKNIISHLYAEAIFEKI